jgi:hypothetical protein
VWQHQRSRSGPNGQPPESSQLERSYQKKIAVRRRGTRLELRERYDDNGWQSKRLVGVYRSWRAVDKAIEDYGEQVIGRR